MKILIINTLQMNGARHGLEIRLPKS